MLQGDPARAGCYDVQEQADGEQGHMRDRGQHGQGNSGGLTSAEAARRRARYGPNAIAQGRATPPLAILARQFRSPLVLILFIAAALAAALGETIDAAAILTIVR
jgi:magnesium-transporting ATPase (P-type)